MINVAALDTLSSLPPEAEIIVIIPNPSGNGQVLRRITFEDFGNIDVSFLIPPGSITTDKIANNAITNDQLASNSVSQVRIRDRAISIDKLDNVIQGRLNTIEGDIEQNSNSISSLIDSHIDGTQGYAHHADRIAVTYQDNDISLSNALDILISGSVTEIDEEDVEISYSPTGEIRRLVNIRVVLDEDASVDIIEFGVSFFNEGGGANELYTFTKKGEVMEIDEEDKLVFSLVCPIPLWVPAGNEYSTYVSVLPRYRWLVGETTEHIYNGVVPEISIADQDAFKKLAEEVIRNINVHSDLQTITVGNESVTIPKKTRLVVK